MTTYHIRCFDCGTEVDIPAEWVRQWVQTHPCLADRDDAPTLFSSVPAR